MLHPIDRVGRVAALAALAVIVVALVALLAQRWVVVGFAFALAIVAGGLVLRLGWGWALTPIAWQIEEVTRTRDTLSELLEVARAEARTRPSDVANPIKSRPSDPGAAKHRPEASGQFPRMVETTRTPTEAAVRAAQLATLYTVGQRSSLRQAALAMEKVSELAPDEAGLRLLMSIGYSASVRGQDLLGAFERRADGLPERTSESESRREPFALREDIAANARALSFELGCEVALRFSNNFPAAALADRVLFRLALTSMLLAAAESGREGAELLIEASHEDLTGANVSVKVAVSATGAATIGELPRYVSHSADTGLPALLALSHLVELDGGHVYGDSSASQLGFTLPVVRYKRITGTTLYGLGTLSERTVLVIDPRPIGRVTICEQLAAWRLAPKGVGSVAEAIEVARDLRANAGRFDLVVVSGFVGDQPSVVLELTEHLPLFGSNTVLSLEDIETMCQPLPPELGERSDMVLRRLPRPPSPIELVELLTKLLVAPPEVHRDTQPRGPGLSLLVADDNTVNQTLMMKILERRGHTVRVANNGADLVDRLSESPGEFDAVFLDIQMPVMDGYEATAVIRLREAQNRRPRVTIIAVTAHALGGERERCFEAGMDGYLAKPIAEDELTEVLEAIASRPKPGDAAPPPPRSPDEVFDRHHVLELAAGDMEFLKGLIDLFGQSAPKLVTQITAHLAHGESDAAYKKAHQLKGSIGNFGADRAREAAADVEHLGRKGETAAASERVPHLKAEVEALVTSLRALVREVAG